MCRTSQAVATALLLLVPGLCAAQSVNMGSTFHGLEARARRVTTTFPNAIVEVRRGEGQRWRRSCAIAPVAKSAAGCRWKPLAPRAVARRTCRTPPRGVRAAGAGNGEPRLGCFPAVRAARRRRSRGNGGCDRRGWRGRRMGRSSAAQPSRARARDVCRAVGRPGRAGRDRVRRRRGACGTRSACPARTVPARGSTTRDSPRRLSIGSTGARRGFVRWFDTAQVLTWKIEGGSQGVILPERMRGGWTFTPTMAWANVQAYQFATQAARTLEPGEPFAGAAAGLWPAAARRAVRADCARRGAAALGRTRGVWCRGPYGAVRRARHSTAAGVADGHSADAARRPSP